MYYYIFDIKRFSKHTQVENIKNYLGILGITGEFTYPTAAQSTEELVDLGLSKQYSTIVVIGGDEMANTVAGKLVGRKEAMGIVPHNASLALNSLVGAENWKQACEVLRFRKISDIRLGKTANNKHFLTSATMNLKTPLEITLEFKDYIVQTKAEELKISNYDPEIKKIGEDFLDVQIISAIQKEGIFNKLSSILGSAKNENPLYKSLIRARSLRIFTKTQIPITCHDYALTKSPQLIESTDETLRLITAKKLEN